MDRPELNDPENAALQLLAATRHPPNDLVRRLDIAERLFPWVKWLVALFIAAIVTLGHAEFKLKRIDDNTQQLIELRQQIEGFNREDTIHLHELWWMKEHGLLTHEEHKS